ncbi:MAG: N-acetyltransferase family protein [Pseudomonadota bacterium]
MTQTVTIRPATPDDAAAIRQIYAPYVDGTAISFEEVVPSVADMAARMSANAASHGYFVAYQDDGQILGYAYGSQYRGRKAYQYTAEVSAYVAQSARGQGVGAALYDVLIPHLRDSGFHALIAVVTLPNSASEKLHERFGFDYIGTTPQVGRKFDSWHDIGIWQRTFE